MLLVEPNVGPSPIRSFNPFLLLGGGLLRSSSASTYRDYITSIPFLLFYKTPSPFVSGCALSPLVHILHPAL